MSYEAVTQRDIEALEAIVGRENCLTGGEIGPDYGHDELGGVERMPDVLLRVHTTQEVSRIMEYANGRGLPVVVRGSGTGLVGAAVAIEGGIMLETVQMNRILELDEENLTVTVQPGVLLMELAEFVQEHNLFYPPDPGEKSATIGGNISTNAGGMRAVKYGVTRDYVRGLTAVLPTGEVLELGGKVVKNSSGYSLKDVIIGSEGTLAVITQAVLRLLPLPPVSVSLLAPFDSLDAALDAVPPIVRSKAAPTAIEYMSRDVILMAEEYLGKKFPDTSAPAYVLLTFDGADLPTVEAEYAKTADLCLELGARDIYLVDTDERKKSVWDARGAFLEAIKASAVEMDECDVVVPRSRIAEYIKFTHALAGETGIRLPSFGHAGDGNLHIYLCRDGMLREEFEKRCRAAFARLYDKAAEFGGRVSGEHGIGWAKKEYLAAHSAPGELELMRRIKLAFDPHQILNPGKVI